MKNSPNTRLVRASLASASSLMALSFALSCSTPAQQTEPDSQESINQAVSTNAALEESDASSNESMDNAVAVNNATEEDAIVSDAEVGTTENVATGNASANIPSNTVSNQAAATPGGEVPELFANAAPQNALPQNTTPTTSEPAPANNAPVEITPPAAAPSEIPASFAVSEPWSGAPVLWWIGYNMKPRDGKVQLELVTRGQPRYDIIQQRNRAGQPELIVSFLNTKIRPKLRRDIDASEFRSPVAWVRTHENPARNASDVIITLRDDVRPRLYSKNGNVLLTFAVPERYLGPASIPVQPIARAEVLSRARVTPDLMQGSDAPVSAIEPYVGNPAGNVFQEAPANGGELLETPVVPQPVAAPEQVSPPAAPVTDATAREITPPSPPAIETPERAPSNLAPTASNATSEVPLPPVNTTITEPIPQTPPPAAMPPPMMPTQPMMPVPQQSAPTNNVPSQENPNLDSDGLNDFDNGGESETNEEKFDVSAPLSSPYIVVSTASYASVGQATPTELEGSANPAMTSPVRTTKRIKELELHEAPLAEFLDAVTAETNLSFIYSPEVGQRKINVSLRDIGWEEALKAVLVSNRLDMENQGRVRRVDTLENLATAADAKRQAQRNIDALTNTKLLVLRLNYAKAATIKATISSILASSGTTDQRVKVESDDRTNTLIVQAIDSDLRKVKTLVERLDLQTPQVKIATRIVEVSNTLDNFLGIGWNGAYNGDSSAGLGFGTLPFPNSVAADYSVDPGVLTGGGRVGSTGFRIGGIQGITDLDLRLKMEEKRSNAQILYSNSVSVEDNQAATFKAGTEEVFIVQGIGTGASGSTQTITYNMTLNVTPHITADNAVQMTLDIQSDDPLKPNSAAATGKTTRGVNTKLIKKNGETAVLGGMYRTSKSVSEDGVPWLSKIPIVGALFRANSSTNSQRETLIMVTPTILNTPGSAASGGPATADFPSSIQNSAPVTTNINNMTNNIEMNNTGAPVNSTKTALNAPLPDDGSNALESEIDVDNAANPE